MSTPTTEQSLRPLDETNEILEKISDIEFQIRCLETERERLIELLPEVEI